MSAAKTINSTQTISRHEIGGRSVAAPLRKMVSKYGFEIAVFSSTSPRAPESMFNIRLASRFKTRTMSDQGGNSKKDHSQGSLN
jgi:hypothetical protein